MPQTPAKLGFISLGCANALIDEEDIITQLHREGYEVTPDYQDADMVVVNTCGFIDAAVEESLDAIGEALNETSKVIVTGCLGAQADIIHQTHPQVLAVTGPHATSAVVDAIHQHLPQKGLQRNPVPPQGIKLTPSHYAYINIAEGCNNHCRFCVIPTLRGGLASRASGDVMQEAENLADAGVKELLIIAQDSCAYGVDINHRTSFWGGRPIKARITELASALGELGIWVRLHKLYPYPLLDELISLMAEGKILPYLDIPLQHVSPDILKAMQRPDNSEVSLARIRQWRETCPELVLHSNFIAGFPGETEDDFEQLLAFISEAKLDSIDAFAYSDIDGARANELPNHVAEELKQERLERLMELQDEISAAKLRARIGQTLEILIDESDGEQAVGHSYANAPESDSQVFLENAANLSPGDMVSARIIEADEYNLWAELLN